MAPTHAPLPLTSLPSSRVPDPASAPPLRWGILSTGLIAGLMTQALAAHTRQQVVAVCSRTMSTAQQFADQYGIDRAHGSVDALVGDENVDVIYVASPHSEHHAHALAAIAAGKNVLVEKAFTRNAWQAEQVVAAARSAKVAVMEAMWARFLPQADVLRQLLADGELGDIVTVAADHGQYFDLDPAHRLFNPDLGGGALLDLGIYPISFASMVLGTPSAIVASGSTAMTGVDGQVSLILQSGEHAQAVLNTTLFAATPTTAAVCGTAAAVTLAGPFYAPGQLTYTHRTGTRLTFDGGPITGHRGLAYEAAHFANLIADGRLESDLMPLDETVQIMRTIDAAQHQLGITLHQSAL